MSNILPVVLSDFRISFQIDTNGGWSAGASLGHRGVGMSGTVSVTGRGLSVRGVSGDVSMNLGFVDLSLNGGIKDLQNGDWSVGARLGCNGAGMSGTITGQGRSVGGVSGVISMNLGSADISLNAGINNIQNKEWFAGGTLADKDNGVSGTATLTGKGIYVSGKISNIEIGPVNLSARAGLDFEQENQASVEENSGESSTQMSDGNRSRKRKRNVETLEDQLPLEKQTRIKRRRAAQITTGE